MAQLVELQGGRQASYEVIGDGEPLLFFVGGPGLPAAALRKDAGLFADRFRSYLIDPHGSGASTPPADPSAYDHLGHVRFYDEVRVALGLDRVAVAGASFGGTVALAYAAVHPEHTTRVIAMGAFGLGTEADEAAGGDAERDMEAMLGRHAGAEWYPEARAVWDTWTERSLAAETRAELDEMLRTVLPLFCAHPDRPEVAAALEASRARALRPGGREGLGGRPLSEDRPAAAAPPHRVPGARRPGELDLICGPAQARPIADAIPGAQLVVIPDCGHMPAIEAPAAYRAAVLDAVGAPAAGPA